jgi:hypothetical protein
MAGRPSFTPFPGRGRPGISAPLVRISPTSRQPEHATRLAIATAVLLAHSLALARPGGEPHPPMRATRLAGTIVVDGRLDEADWARAEPFDAFVQSFPTEGAPPSQRTEVRVLYDDRTLYVGIRCHDTEAGRVLAPLGRRDKPPASDNVQVVIDANLDRRTAVFFQVTAGGVLADAPFYDDDRQNFDWDAVWDGAAALEHDGWSAELAIPISVLRFPAAPVQTWGFGVQREIGRSHERSATVLLPRNARGVVSRLGTLTGMEGLRPGLDLEVTPYLAARLAHAPLHGDASYPRPRVWNPAADVGADLNMRLGSRLTLTGALNPDFGQVEADQIILNLSTYEQFFPEKRPFFNQGLDLFQPPGTGFEDRVPQQMFYSRRIGLDTPILGAAKLVGRVSDRVEVGLLDAVVSGSGIRGAAGQGSMEAAESSAGSGPRWSFTRPFHLAPERSLPVVDPVTVNQLAGVVRVEAAERLVLGLQGTSALPGGPRCVLTSQALDALPDNQRPAGCDTFGGNALALDFNTTSQDGEWYAYGQAAGSQVVGGRPSRTLADGIELRRGDTGLGSYLRAGRRGGEPWRVELAWNYASPRQDLNASGYQRTQNEQAGSAVLKYTRPSGNALVHEYTAYGGAVARWTTDGRGLPRGAGATVGLEVLLRQPYMWLNCSLSWDDPQLDVREIDGSGVPLRRPGWNTYGCYTSTDQTRPVALEGWVGVMKNLPFPPLSAPWAQNASLVAVLRPHPRAETRLGFNYDSGAFAVRYVGDLGALPVPGGTLYPFASLSAPSVSLVLRQTLVLTPRLTFQLYGQLFSAAGRYGQWYTATRASGDRSTVERGQLQATSYQALASLYAAAPADRPARPDFHDTQLVLNAVLRWEYRPGSTLYAVYARSQAELPWSRGGFPDFAPAPASLAPRALATGPATDSLLVKWAFWTGA